MRSQPPPQSLLDSVTWTPPARLSAQLILHLPFSDQEPGVSQGCLSFFLKCPQGSYPHFSFFWVSLNSWLPLEALPRIPTLSRRHPAGHTFPSPFSSSCSQNLKFIFTWVCFSSGFLLEHCKRCEGAGLVCLCTRYRFLVRRRDSRKRIDVWALHIFIRWEVWPVSYKDVRLFFFCFEIGSCYIAQAGLKLTILLSLGYRAWLRMCNPYQEF